YFVQLETIPLTPSGKVDRNRLPAPGLTAEDNYVAPRDRLERQLVELWQEVLAWDDGSNGPSIGIDDDFFQLGGHSLRGTVLVTKIHKALHTKVSLTQLFATPTVRGLAQTVRETKQDRYASIEPAEKRDYYPLSSPQKRLFILQQMEAGHTGYNMPQFIPLPASETIDMQKLEQTFERLITRHESLRTSFHMVRDRPVQRIHDGVEFRICRGVPPWSPLNGNNSDVNNNHLGSHGGLPLQSFIRPFDLSQAPLLRVGLGNTKEGQPILMIDMHHIISDGVSHGILQREWRSIFAGEEQEGELPELRLQYKDYALWLTREEQQLLIKDQENYWLRRFTSGGEIPVLTLPIDYPRPVPQDFEGHTVGFMLSQEETQALKSTVTNTNATLYMTILAVFSVLLSKVSGQEGIIIGSPVAARRHADLQSIMGMFVNTLAIRSDLHSDLTFEQLIRDVKDHTTAAFENQEYPFEELVDKLSIPRDTGRNPLFDIMFNMLNQADFTGDPMETDNNASQKYIHRKEVARFDLTLTAVDLGERLYFTLNYCSRLFKPGTIERMIRYFKTLATQLTANPARLLSGTEIITPEEKRQILEEFNDTRRPYPVEKTIHQLFEEQASQTPDDIALAAEDSEQRLTQLTYRDLNHRAGGLADLLRKKGVEPDTIVAIMVDRSIDVIIGILGIIKAGGAYLPIAPDYPQERIDFMLRDSCSGILLLAPWKRTPSGPPLNEAPQPPLSRGEFGSVEIIELPGIFNSPLERGTPPAAGGGGSQADGCLNLANIIYTSGSTGTPKGVMVEHWNVVHLVKNTNYMVFDPGDRFMQTCAITFDVSTFEIWGTLLNGLQLHFPNETTLLNPGELKTALRRYRIDTIWMTASLFNQMVDVDIDLFDSLKRLLVGGDVLSPPHINRVRKHSPHLTIINGYGPTENTTFSTTFQIDREYDRDIPIGFPIANSTAYIVDRSNHLMPVGVPGELAVGGDGVSRGYLNNPELTKEKFDHDFKDWKDGQDFKKETFTPSAPPAVNLYRTGDLARWLEDGNIQFLGRRDQQVKIRGFRIEPGEIESRLSGYSGVKNVAVLAREDNNGEKYLCAYFVSDRKNNNE
ncbi:MAG: amino acid adenylation domain-containing protein, partial [bacterium]|nr:amino acid adenylation domain-containing protein [bacterium]